MATTDAPTDEWDDVIVGAGFSELRMLHRLRAFGVSAGRSRPRTRSTARGTGTAISPANSSGAEPDNAHPTPRADLPSRTSPQGEQDARLANTIAALLVDRRGFTGGGARPRRMWQRR
jgi:hypothetical protein